MVLRENQEIVDVNYGARVDKCEGKPKWFSNMDREEIQTTLITSHKRKQIETIDEAILRGMAIYLHWKRG
jgi:hypothetical protein